MLEAWRRIHDSHHFLRRAAKLFALALVVALVLYPKVWLLPTWWSRVRDMNSVLQPDHPGLAPFEAQVRARVPANASAKVVLRNVEQVVYERIPYAWDWDTWGVMDYLPTVNETLALGREDCDGRAVVAASILRRMGYDAWLVTDMTHTWVATKDGETMSPGAGAKSFVATAAGTKPSFDWGLLKNIANGLTFGLRVFPPVREVIILVAVCVLSMQPRSSVWRRIAGCALLAATIAIPRIYAQISPNSHPMPTAILWMIVIAGVCGWLLLVVRGAKPLPRSAVAQPG